MVSVDHVSFLMDHGDLMGEACLYIFFMDLVCAVCGLYNRWSL